MRQEIIFLLSAGYNFWKALLDRGVYVNLLMPPATPGGDVALRFSVSAAHTPQDIETAIGAFGDAAASLGTARASV
jgi:8-amino-7-oxononanoate synthase